MNIVQEVQKLTELRNGFYNSGDSIGFVPTMGALHEGHLSLIRRAKKENRFVFVSIFVNPAQFSAGEDLERYPRVLKEDIALLEEFDIDVLFTPGPEELYPTPPLLQIDIPAMSSHLCGAHRKGHFAGVLLVVLKLFHIMRPHKGYFGKKDYQQYILIKRMAEELLLQTDIIPCDIVREKTGLAMSSRNRYLSEKEHKQASAIFHILSETKKARHEQGLNRAEDLTLFCRNLLKKAGIEKTDYVEVCDKITLLNPEKVTDGCILLVAVHIGNTRLIDNIEL